MQVLPILSVLTISLAGVVFGWPSGAPDSVCDSLTPKHGQNQGKQTASPFIVSQSQSNFEPGDRIKGKSFTLVIIILLCHISYDITPITVFIPR